MRPSDLDFVTYHEDHEVCDIVNHPILKQICNLLDKYQALIDENKSFVRHRNPDPYVLHWSSFEANLRELFHNRGPCLVADENKEDSPALSLNWVDIIREAEENDLILQDDGSYHYNYRGRLVRLSEHEKGYVIRLRTLLKPWPHPEDMRKEKTAIETVMEDLGQYENALVAAIECKKNIATRLNDRREMINRYLDLFSGPSGISRPRDSSLVSLVSREPSPVNLLRDSTLEPLSSREPSPVNILRNSPLAPSLFREPSPVNSIVQDTRGDIEYVVSSDDSSSTDQSSDEDMEMPDARREKPEERSMDVLPDILPVTPQRADTRETEVTLLNEPASTSSARLPLDEFLSSAGAIYESDEADSSSISRPVAQTRRRHPRIYPTEEETKNGYKFVKDQKASKASWDLITLEYNRAFGVDRTKQGLKSMVDRWKSKAGDKKPSSASRRGTWTSRGSRLGRSWRKSLNGPGQRQSGAASSPRGAHGSRETLGSSNRGPSLTSTA
ncbi:hypothetical protein F1880_004391 [Penicillium rolfsii]|nr:hypothetical protein F1880_004391 [Penicillium rolfsii]